MAVDLPLPLPPLIVSAQAVTRAYARNYFDEGGRKLASSREVPATMPDYPLGTWRVDDDFEGSYGHELSVLVVFDQPRELEPGEFGWEAPERTMDRRKLPDVDQYVEWLDAGFQPPPIEVVETDHSTLRVVNGHRRLLAADRAGLPVLAWLSPMVEHPERQRDAAGHVLLVPLTWERATGRPWSWAEAAAVGPTSMTPNRRRRQGRSASHP